MPFGGGGALHASALIKEIGLRCAIVPRFPGVTSALGCVIADLRHDQVQTVNLALDDLDAAALDARMVAAGEEARGVVEVAGIAVERIDVLYELDMHYLGQTHTVAVPLPVTLANGRTGITEAAIRAAFDKAYAVGSSAGCFRGFRSASCRCAPPRSVGGRRSISPRSPRLPTARCRRPRVASGRCGSPANGTLRGCGRGSICPPTR